MTNKTIDKALGAMLGLAIGDALGAPVEFLLRDSFPPVTDFQSGGKFHLPAGTYTDDTAMALCLAQSLIDKQGCDPIDQLEKYLRWLNEGYMSATGKSVGCGKTIYRALLRFMAAPKPQCGNARMKRQAGNGSLMRVAPIAIYYRHNLHDAYQCAQTSSYTTHGLKICADACIVYVGLLVGLLEGKSKDEVLSGTYAEYLLNDVLEQYRIEPEIANVLHGSYKTKPREAIRSGGYVLDSLEAALWAFYHGSDYAESVLMAVNLGEDSDTTAAICGALAGAWDGYKMLPDGWKNRLANRARIEATARKLVSREK